MAGALTGHFYFMLLKLDLNLTIISTSVFNKININKIKITHQITYGANCFVLNSI
jgi:hypothetical protein